MSERTIKHLALVTSTPSRLIVVDDGSDRETNTMLQRLKREGFIDTLIRNKYNIGLEPSKNLGLQAVKSDYFISTDNDCLPEYPRKDDWLAKLIHLMDMNPGYGAIACRTQVMIGTGNIFEQADETGEPLVDFPHPGGSVRIMQRKLITRIGGWRDWVESRGSEEKHIGGKLREIGFRSAFATHVRCYHMFGDDANWGYGTLEPEKHGHTPIWHPAIQNGDDEGDIERWLKHEE
jgi:glycosyltransferase involved in cell wall biosynthesis